MLELRKAEHRGQFDFGWLQARYSFSFGNYYDPAHTGFRNLLVMNHDNIKPSMGFGEHPHRDMEIVSFIIKGELKHKDSEGHEAVIGPGQIQKMSAGTGIRHSEFNPNPDQETEMLQIWIKPDKTSIKPEYWEASYRDDVNQNGLTLLVAPTDDEAPVKIHQDSYIYVGNYDAGQTDQLKLAEVGMAGYN